jgi:hypothetical protein
MSKSVAKKHNFCVTSFLLLFALFFIFQFVFSMEAGNYRYETYGVDFNVSNWVIDVNGALDTDSSAVCTLIGKNDSTNSTVFNNTAMNADTVNLGFYYYEVAASNTVAWPKGKYSVIMTCTDGNLTGSENVSFIIGDDVTQLITDANSYLTRLMTDLNSIGRGFNSDQNSILYNINSNVSTINSNISSINSNIILINSKLTDINNQIYLVPSLVWTNSSRTLSDYNQQSIFSYLESIQGIVTDVNGMNWISAADVWNYSTRTLSDYNQQTMFEYLDRVNARTIDINGRAWISAADVWNFASRNLTDYNQADLVNYLNEIRAISVDVNANAWISAADVWAYAERKLTDYNYAPMVNYLEDINVGVRDINSRTYFSVQDIWNYSVRTLSDYNQSGMFAYLQDINSTTNSINSTVSNIWLNQSADFKATLSDVGQIAVSKVYRSKLWVFDFNGSPKDCDSTPTVTLFDPVRNEIVSAVNMTRESLGIYTYNYTTSSGQTAGLWETIVTAQVNGVTVKPSDFWELTGSPPEVKIDSITDDTISDITAKALITNEGLTAEEYQYEYCIVANQSNQCGGDDDVDYSSGAKLLNPSETWTKNLTLNVSTAGTYYFKVKVYYAGGTSGATKQFSAVAASSGTGGTGGTGGDGGGGGGGSGGGIVSGGAISPGTGLISLPSSSDSTNSKLVILEVPSELNAFVAETTFLSLQIKNSGTNRIDDIKLIFDGFFSNWYVVEYEKTSLNVGEISSIVVKINPSEKATIKDYLLKLKISSSVGGVVGVTEKDFVLRVLENPNTTLKLVEVFSNAIKSNRDGTITTEVYNSGTATENFLVSLLAPLDWGVEQESISVTLFPGEKKNVTFNVTPSSRAGIQELVLSIKKVGVETSVLSREIYLIVPAASSVNQNDILSLLTGGENGFSLIAFSIIILLLLVGIVLTYSVFVKVSKFDGFKKEEKSSNVVVDVFENHFKNYDVTLKSHFGVVNKKLDKINSSLEKKNSGGISSIFSKFKKQSNIISKKGRWGNKK